MMIVSYDMSDDKLRTKFAKFLAKHGSRLQYSVFEIENSPRVLDLIHLEIKYHFEPSFSGADSVVIFRFTDREVTRYGNAKHRNQDLLIF